MLVSNFYLHPINDYISRMNQKHFLRKHMCAMKKQPYRLDDKAILPLTALTLTHRRPQILQYTKAHNNV